VAVASAGLSASLHLIPDNHANIPPVRFFTGRMPFLPPNQQHQSTEGKKHCFLNIEIFLKLLNLISPQLFGQFQQSFEIHLLLFYLIKQQQQQLFHGPLSRTTWLDW